MVKKFIEQSVKNGSNILFQKQSSIISGALIIAIMLLASAILGLIKKRLYASVITPGPELDIFFAAFRWPDLTFQLIVGGALNAAFIPVFAHLIGTRSKNGSWQFVSTVLNCTIVAFTLISILFLIFMDQLAIIIGVGFSESELMLLKELMRILLISPIILGVSSFIAGTLQSFQRFLLPFLSPVVYNLGSILGVIFLYPIWGIKGIAWGVVIGSVAHLLVQIPLLFHLQFKYSLKSNLKDPAFQKMLKLSFFRTIGAGVEQIKSVVLISLASILPRGGISVFDLGLSITSIPVSIIGVSISQASLPEFSSLVAKGDMVNLRRTFISSLNQITFFLLPISVVLIVLKIPVVRLIYGAGNFTWEDTVVTSWVVATLAIGLIFQALNNLIVRLFYSLHETKLPVFVSIISIIITILISYFFTNRSELISIRIMSLAISIGAGIEFILLIILLQSKNIIKIKEMLVTPIKIVIASIITAIVIYIPVKLLDQIFIDTTRVVNLLILVWLVLSFGVTTYLIITWLLGVSELKIIFKILFKMKILREKVERSFRIPELMTNPITEEEAK